MMYEGFANVYDHMMNHIPYETWFENLLQYLHEKGVLKRAVPIFCICIRTWKKWNWTAR